MLKYNSRLGASDTSPLVFLVHGRAGNISVMSTFARLIPDGWHVVFVEAPINDPIGGFSWWDINSPAVDKQKQESFQQLDKFIREYSVQQKINPANVLAVGFSQGAAILSLIFQDDPDLLQGVALLSGFIFIRDISPHKYPPKIFIAHGNQDQVVPLEKLQRGIDHLKMHGFEIETVFEDVGHKVGIQGMRALKEWINRYF